MTQQLINVGTVANDGTGDTIRGAMNKVNSNFTEVYGKVATLDNSIGTLTPGGIAYVSSSSKLTTVPGLTLDQFGTIRFDRTTNSDSLPAIVISDTFNTVLTLVEYSDSDTNAPALALYKNRGTKSAASPAIFGDTLGTVSVLGSDNTASGRIIWKASSTTTSNITDSTFEIQTKINGTLASRLSITEEGYTNVNSIKFQDSTVQSSAAISISALKTLVAASTDFADFQSRIAAL